MQKQRGHKKDDRFKSIPRTKQSTAMPKSGDGDKGHAQKKAVQTL